MTPLFVFCADLHLDDGAWSTRPGIYGDSYYSFSQIVTYCVSHNLPLVLGGDVLEKKSNSARPIAKLCAGLSQMQSAGVPVYYIQGNHEYDRNAPWLSVHPWPQHMHSKGVCDIGGVSVAGLDWLPRGEIQSALSDVPQDTEILVTHQVWKDFMGNVGRPECELTDVHHVGTVLAGDFHITKTVESKNAQNRPVKMLSPGSTSMQDIGECPDKCFFVIAKDVDGFSFQRVDLLTRQFRQFVVETQEELDELCAGALGNAIEEAIGIAESAGVPEEIIKPFVRVRFNKQIPDAYIRITTIVGETAHLFCDALPDKKTANKSCDKERQPTVKNTVLTALADLLGEQTQEYKLAAKLVQSVSPAKELDAQFKKHMGEADATSSVSCKELGAPS